MRALRLLLAAGLLATLAPLVHAEPDRRQQAMHWFLAGRPDRLEGFLGIREEPADLWPLAFRDLWWRRTTDAEARARYEAAAARAGGETAERWRWVMEGGSPGRAASDDPDVVLLALAVDRAHREEHGLYPPGLDPLSQLLKGGPHEADVARFVREIRDVAYAGPPSERDADAVRAFESARTRGTLLAVAAVVAFVAAAGLLGRRAGRVGGPSTRRARRA